MKERQREGEDNVKDWEERNKNEKTGMKEDIK